MLQAYFHVLHMSTELPAGLSLSPARETESFELAVRQLCAGFQVQAFSAPVGNCPYRKLDLGKKGEAK
jgi:hypothetical protein